jgi:GT2 family glycosyltransferase
MSLKSKPVAVGKPRIAAVIPCHDVSKTISATLEGLAASSLPLAEIVCVDDASEDATRMVIEHVSRSSPMRIRLIDSDGRRRGPAAARNRGAQQVTCDYILFIDADVVVEPSTIERLLQELTETDYAAAVGHFKARSLQDSVLAHFQADTVHAIFSSLNPHDCPCFGTQCVLIKTDVFRLLQGFDEGYPSATVEDFAFGYRLRRRGWTIRLVHEAAIQHNHAYTWRSFARNYFTKARDLTSLLLWESGVALADSGYCTKSNSTALMLLSATPLCLVGMVMGYPRLIWGLAAIPTFIAVVWWKYLLRIRRSQGMQVALQFYCLRIAVVVIAGVASAVALGSVLLKRGKANTNATTNALDKIQEL